MPYDPIDDEKKEFTLEEFIATAKEELDSYQKTWEGPDTMTSIKGSTLGKNGLLLSIDICLGEI